MHVVHGLEEWRVTLRDGSVLRFWADSCSVQGDEHVLQLLVDASPAERAGLDIVGMSQRDPARVFVALARIPSSLVASVSNVTLASVVDEFGRPTP
jgi:hypothetical protein